MVSNNERHRFYALIKSLFRLLLGRKTPTEEYLTRIRTARNTDGTKRFKPHQYLKLNQVRTVCSRSFYLSAFVVDTKSDQDVV